MLRFFLTVSTLVSIWRGFSREAIFRLIIFVATNLCGNCGNKSEGVIDNVIGCSLLGCLYLLWCFYQLHSFQRFFQRLFLRLIRFFG